MNFLQEFGNRRTGEFRFEVDITYLQQEQDLGNVLGSAKMCLRRKMAWVITAILSDNREYVFTTSKVVRRPHSHGEAFHMKLVSCLKNADDAGVGELVSRHSILADRRRPYRMIDLEKGSMEFAETENGWMRVE